ncbi:MAG: YicC/YloC family endoribonuclease [Hyphomonadaceae bacterium]|nr:YicC/YloC family endoribonuclease [Hyphomonadaceae bacterium]
MAIAGMTGFARSEGAVAGRRWIWELRSVNGRGLDVKCRLPPGYEALDAVAREGAAKRFRRGTLQASLTVARDGDGAGAPRVDLAFVARLLADVDPFLRDGRIDRPRLDGLLQVRGVLVTEDALEPGAEDRAALDAAILEGLAVALDKLAVARAHEGRALGRVLQDLIGQIEACTQAARATAATAPSALAEKLKDRLAALAPEVLVDPARFAQEAALLAARADVQEELERLRAHAAEARALIAGEEPAGRRLDFLAQELNREANTLCSKASDLALTRIGLDLKTAIDQFREQCANAE